MPANYVLLERITLTASAASVVLDNIPQTGYTDLKLVISGRSDRNVFDWTNIKVQFNGTTSGYTYRQLVGDGSSASSVNNTSDGEGSTGIIVFSMGQANSGANIFGNCEVYIPNYTSSNFKSISSDGVMDKNTTNSGMALTAGLWSNTAAINSITLTPQISGSNFNFVANSEFSLYGIAAVGTTPVIAPKASGGDIVVNDGIYWYHAFLGSSVFTPTQALNADVLVIAGGGSGGNNASGGGGAGGLLYSASNALTSANNYIATIGAGGANQVNYSASGLNGNNSTFSGSGFTTLTAIGGGAGQGPVSTPAGSGGSGGGAAGYSGSPAIGTGTSGQGNNGGTAGAAGESGGGGGAGAAGGNGGNNSARTGVGGAGVNTYSSWASATGTGVSGFYAGGGGGGAGQTANSNTNGGSGGGGKGAGSDQNPLATAGTMNTGSGGGGTAYGNTSASSNTGGGSGIIIIRYAV